MSLHHRRRRGGNGRLLLAGVIALIAFVSFLSTRSTNPVTGQTQYVALTPAQEIALGLQAAPQMAAQFGGLHPDPKAQALIDSIGARLVAGGPAREAPYEFDFHLLADPNVVNAFALPGGQVFITAALFNKLETEGQLAGILAHEIGHIIERHGAERLAKEQLTAGLVGAAAVAGSDPDNPLGGSSAMLAAAVGKLINMRYGREDELECDAWGVRLSAAAGYDPHAMIRVMEILDEAAKGPRPPEFLSTHPDPGNRIERIRATIKREFPKGLPPGLEP